MDPSEEVDPSESAARARAFLEPANAPMRLTELADRLAGIATPRMSVLLRPSRKHSSGSRVLLTEGSTGSISVYARVTSRRNSTLVARKGMASSSLRYTRELHRT